MTVRRRNVLIGATLVVLIGGAGVGAYVWEQRWPKRFAEVVPQRLYRSGDVTPAQLARVHEQYHIGRVLCMLNPADPDATDEIAAEQAMAERLGIEWINIPLRGNGASTPADRERIVEIVTDEDAPPTLVHCSAGVNRTGLAVGLYRIHVEGWTYEQVLAELRANDFDDLPKHENMRTALREAAAAHEVAEPSTALGER